MILAEIAVVIGILRAPALRVLRIIQNQQVANFWNFLGGGVTLKLSVGDRQLQKRKQPCPPA